MIDYFALLDQPRAPWLDLETLKQAYHQKTFRAHPDTHTTGRAEEAAAAFSTLNEAYQTLHDPKRRLHHLLSLQGCAPSPANQTIPEQLHDLFPSIGGLTQRAGQLLEKLQATSNALSRSLLKPQLLELQKETNELRQRIQNLSDASLAQLREINSGWMQNPEGQLTSVSNLYFAFAYLTRWSAQLDEMAFQLSLL